MNIFIISGLREKAIFFNPCLKNALVLVHLLFMRSKSCKGRAVHVGRAASEVVAGGGGGGRGRVDGKTNCGALI